MRWRYARGRGLAGRLVWAIVSAVWLWSACSAESAIVLRFSDGDGVDGDGPGDRAGPFFDPATSVSAQLITSSITPDGRLNSTGSGLGVNALGADRSGRFDDGEAWSFRWDVDTLFLVLDLADINTTTESFDVRADAWINLGVTPGSPSVTYDKTRGAFRLAGTQPGDRFSLDDLTSGQPLFLPAGESVELAARDVTGGEVGTIEGLEVETVPVTVPEPSSLWLAGCLSGGWTVARWRRARCRRRGSAAGGARVPPY